MVWRYHSPGDPPKWTPKNNFFYWFNLGCQFFFYINRSEVESRTQGSRPRPRPRTQKKSEAKAKAKDSPSEDRTSRGQGQECSRPRPRTKDTGASVLQKKVFKNFFQAISNSLACPEFIGISLNHKSNEMTSSKFFQRGSFCGINI